MKAGRIEPGPGQESVWDYPRPPAAVEVEREVVVRFGGKVVGRTDQAGQGDGDQPSARLLRPA